MIRHPRTEGSVFDIRNIGVLSNEGPDVVICQKVVAPLTLSERWRVDRGVRGTSTFLYSPLYTYAYVRDTFSRLRTCYFQIRTYYLGISTSFLQKGGSFFARMRIVIIIFIFYPTLLTLLTPKLGEGSARSEGYYRHITTIVI